MKWFFRIFFKTVRLILGPFVLLFERLTMPTAMIRPDDEQQRVEQAISKLTLYQFRTCPFCLKVRHAMRSLSLDIETRDAQRDPQVRAELLNGGGRIKVPCLRIVTEQGEENWMYESSHIVEYLNQHFR